MLVCTLFCLSSGWIGSGFVQFFTERHFLGWGFAISIKLGYKWIHTHFLCFHKYMEMHLAREKVLSSCSEWCLSHGICCILCVNKNQYLGIGAVGSSGNCLVCSMWVMLNTLTLPHSGRVRLALGISECSFLVYGSLILCHAQDAGLEHFTSPLR